MPEEFFLADLIANQQLNIIFGLLISILACLSSFLFINHITASLRKIRRIAEDVRCGKFTKSPLSTSSFIELQQTQYAFNNMIDSLIASRQENKQLHLTLAKTDSETFSRLSIVAEYKNDSSANHLRRVSRYSEIIALSMGMPEAKAKLHDLGKLGIPDKILTKPAVLTAAEWKTMQNAPLLGARILHDAESSPLKAAHDITLTLHENWDGSGYPHQLTGQDIPLSARIVAVADTFDTMLHARSYKAALSIETAVAEIRALSGHKFDPKVVANFDSSLLAIVDIYNELSPNITVYPLPLRRQQ